MARLEQDLEQAELRGELTMLRALESLRAEHQRALEKETERTELWIKEIKKSHATERTQLLERIAGLVRSVGVSTRELTPEGHDPSGTTA